MTKSNRWSLLLLICIMILAGCFNRPSAIKDEKLRDRVCACAAGFGEKISAKLTAEYDWYLNKGMVKTEAQRKTAAAIMELLPKEDRLEGYQKYIDCLGLDKSYDHPQDEPIGFEDIIIKGEIRDKDTGELITDQQAFIAIRNTDYRIYSDSRGKFNKTIRSKIPDDIVLYVQHPAYQSVNFSETIMATDENIIQISIELEKQSD